MERTQQHHPRPAVTLCKLPHARPAGRCLPQPEAGSDEGPSSSLQWGPCRPQAQQLGRPGSSSSLCSWLAVRPEQDCPSPWARGFSSRLGPSHLTYRVAVRDRRNKTGGTPVTARLTQSEVNAEVIRGFPGGSGGEELPAMQELIPGSRRPPGEGSSYPHQYSCWRIPRTEEPGGLQPMGSQTVRQD